MNRKRKALLATGAVVLLALFVLRITGGRIGFVTIPANEDAYRNGIRTVSLSEQSERWIRDTPVSLSDVTEEIGLDLRSIDASKLQLADAREALETVLFDTHTVWPDALPASFDPVTVLETGKNPGLGIRDIHAAGLTGKGVGIAIIDMGLQTEHEEYRDAIMGYECLHAFRDSGASMHGAAVTSIAAGKTCGVAPGASVYYISCAYVRLTPFGYRVDLGYLGKR